MYDGRMPFWKKSLLNAFYHTTAPARRLERRRRAAASRAPLGIAVFHRIADDEANDWTTSTADFIEAVRWLRANCELISLAEVQRRIRSGGSDRPAVAITFDDGYAENCDVALPLLIQEHIPCVYFVATGHVIDGRPFAHDVQMGNHFRPNTVTELRDLSRQGIEIGAHTRTHANLGAIADRQELADELVAARDDLAAAIDQRVRYFAFPFGLHQHLSSEAIHLAARNGFEAVCSAYGGYNVPGDDPFHLQRRGVDGPVIRLKNWALFNPLHAVRVRRFEYSPAEAASPDGPAATAPSAAGELVASTASPYIAEPSR